MLTQPRLRIRRATPADASACIEIRFTAFRPGPMSRCLWPGDFSAAAFEQQVDRMRKEIETEGQDKSKCHVIVAELLPESEIVDKGGEVDGVATDGGREAFIPAAGTEAAEVGVLATAGMAEDGGKEPERGPNPRARPELLRNPITGGTIVAFAKWHLYREEIPESEWAERKPATREQYGEGANLEVCEAFLGGLRNMRQDYIGGRPHFLLSLIACSPNHQRLGAATALVRWGTSLADREGFVSWLESSPPGYPVYNRCGFRDVAVLDLDVTKRWGIVRTDAEDWGVKNAVDVAGDVPGDGWFRTVLMKREPLVRTVA